MARSIVDPRFAATLRRLRIERGLGLRALADQVHIGKSTLHDLETGKTPPTPEIAQLLDDALGAGGELARLVHADNGVLTPDDDARLAWAVQHPRHVDPAVVESLTTVLAHQRRLEDVAGSAVLVAPVVAQLAVIERLVDEAADGDARRALIDVAGQWAQFAGWLSATTGDHAGGRAWYVRSLEWATEAGNPDLAATSLSMRGHLAWVRGQLRAMIDLSRAAAWQPAVSGAVKANAVQQEARGLALLGDAADADPDDRLDLAEELAARAADERDGPPWMYFYDPTFFALQRGLSQHYLGRHERAAEQLTAALDALPADIRSSDWIGWYVLQLADALARSGDRDGAANALAEARRVVAATGAERLRNDVEALARKLRL